MFEKEKLKKDESFFIKGAISQNVSRELISVINKEVEALNFLIKNFPSQAEFLVEKILQTQGHIVFSGIGKSGLIAKKLAATFSSTGTPALFLHPSEALHGDLGMISQRALFIAISKSGTGTELEQIIPLLRSQGNFCCLIACADSGSLSKMVDLPIVLPFKSEACELNLAPTSSTTVCMAFGDALAVVVSKIKGFNKNDFAKFHPSGALGKKLLLKVEALMSKEEQVPLLYPDASFKDVILKITTKKLGVGIVVDQNKRLLGIITDGDLRRACELGPKIFEKFAKDIMTPDPKRILPENFAYDALQLMGQFNITSLIVTTQDKKVVGLIHIHDLVKAGIS